MIPSTLADKFIGNETPGRAFRALAVAGKIFG
jgi:hypothetical protein